MEIRGKKESIKHVVPSASKDVKLLIDQLTECNVFTKSPNRQPPSFHFKHGLLESYDKEKLINWLVENVIVEMNYK